MIGYRQQNIPTARLYHPFVDQIAVSPAGTTQKRMTILDYLTDAAERSLPCPTNRQIADALRYQSEDSASSMVYRLRREGKILVNSVNSHSRTITIVATGKTTAPTRAGVNTPHRMAAE